MQRRRSTSQAYVATVITSAMNTSAVYSSVLFTPSWAKSSVARNLKDPTDLARARAMAVDVDFLIEQFRPRVMKRLGLPYEDLSADNSLLVYCSITGYGQDAPKAQVTANNLNYAAAVGPLWLVTDEAGMPVLTAKLMADLEGSVYPTVISILVSPIELAQGGKGRYLDISMSESLCAFMSWASVSGVSVSWPKPTVELVSSGIPRCRIYRTKDAILPRRRWRLIRSRFSERSPVCLRLRNPLPLQPPSMTHRLSPDRSFGARCPSLGTPSLHSSAVKRLVGTWGSCP
jgi:crotonobetainyl-CoA:carnitine CoA-transferase CaiB-like acyl-CoA transferase